jgi:hypothetical protein
MAITPFKALLVLCLVAWVAADAERELLDDEVCDGAFAANAGA